MPNCNFLFSIVLVFVINLGAAVTAQQLPTPVFPETIQQCIAQGNCTTPVRGGLINFFTPLIEQYRYTETSFSGAIVSDMFLLRYSLGGESNFQGQVNDFFGEPSFTEDLFFGEAWLSVNESYQLGNFNSSTPIHQFTLYTDQIAGGDNIGFGSPDFGRDINLLLSDDALLAGGGSFLTEVNNSPGSTDLSVDADLFPCLSEGCFVGAEFNLVGLRYQQIGSTAGIDFIPPTADPEGQLLYSQRRGFPGFFGTAENFFDQQTSLVVGESVPEPGTAVVQVLALLWAVSTRRRLH